jgi:hypothetical protein
MKVRVPKELTPGQRRRAKEWALELATDELEHQGRVMLDTFIKMICLDLHDKFQWEEEQLMLLLGSLRGLFHQQQKLVKEGKQMEYLNKRMSEIFKKGGYPDDYFARMFEGGLK